MTETTATPVTTPRISYKGFDENFQCRGFQYAVGETYTHEGEVEACASGFHACPMPIGVFNYYPPYKNRFAIVEQAGEMSEKRDKVASSILKVKAEISLFDLIKAQIDWVFSRAKNSNNQHSTGYQGAASSTGDQGAAS
ncbi:MAG TPA: hypothetical protein PLB10_19145, partial [Thiolinea sp.]|nr:hypothetical protein [Thiolinea sp.]